jgi:6-phosphogluconolactonase
MSDQIKPQVTVVPDKKALAQAAADQFVAAAQQAIADHGVFTVALSGGSTPRDLFALLANEPWRDQVDWSRTQVFWGDDRLVSPDDERSNYRMAREGLLEKVPLPAANVHRMLTELPDREAAASQYADAIARVVPADEQGVPSFDLILLGLGDDGHTASLLPGSALVHEQSRMVAVTDREREGTLRLTFTPPVLQHARRLLFLLAGSDKAQPLREVLYGEEQRERYPAQVVRDARGEVTYLIDSAAASNLPASENRA